jgi:hypothetical protein
MSNLYKIGARALTPGRDVVTAAGVVIPYGNLDRWPVEELTAHGITRTALPAPDAPTTRQFSFLAFMELFTPAEQLALAGAAMADVAVKLWYDRALGAEYVDLDDSRTIAGVGVMAALGLLTEERASAVLDGVSP